MAADGMAANRKSRIQISVVEEDPELLDYIRQILGDEYNVSLSPGTSEASARLDSAAAPDLVLLDFHIDGDPTGDSAIRLLAKIRKAHPLLPVVMLSCSGESQELVRASKAGAADFILKPFSKGDIDQAVQRHVAPSDGAQSDAKEIVLDEDTSFVRASQRMRQIESQCRLVATTDIPVLILGESGTGKEIAAMFIHKMSGRSQRPFLKVNCAAMPLDLLESELFGYEQGAFTGAVKSKPGKFEVCNNGTIFLDEIGEMPTALQAKLLQVLQDGTFSRLGSRTTIKVDVRVVAATNINIKQAIAQKTFREDLYYRLNCFNLSLPPLRERREEIPVLTGYFMRRIAAKFGREPLPVSSTLLQAFTSYAWPGNIRELENTIKRYFVLGDEQSIIHELHPEINFESLNATAEPGPDRGGLKHLVRGLKGDAESVVIAQTLEGTGWNRKAAASTLKISYKALLYKIKQYNLTQPERL